MAATGTDLRELTVDSEFAGLCPALKAEELSLLEASLERDGCRDPIIVWANHDDTILDGHNRYRYCRRFDVPFKTKAMVFEDRNACRNWIIENQLARRNCTEEQKAYLRGQRYITAEKQQGERKDLTSGHDVPKSQRTSEALAQEYGVDEKTIRRDAKYAEAVDSIAKSSGQKAKQAILSGELKIKKKDAVKLAALPKDEQKAAIQGGSEAIKKAVSPPKEKPSHPYSDAFVKWLDLVREELSGMRHQFGSLTEMMNHKKWDQSQTSFVRQMLGSLQVTLGQLKKEADQYVSKSGEVA